MIKSFLLNIRSIHSFIFGKEINMKSYLTSLLAFLKSQWSRFTSFSFLLHHILNILTNFSYILVFEDVGDSLIFLHVLSFFIPEVNIDISFRAFIKAQPVLPPHDSMLFWGQCMWWILIWMIRSCLLLSPLFLFSFWTLLFFNQKYMLDIFVGRF